MCLTLSGHDNARPGVLFPTARYRVFVVNKLVMPMEQGGPTTIGLIVLHTLATTNLWKPWGFRGTTTIGQRSSSRLPHSILGTAHREPGLSEHPVSSTGVRTRPAFGFWGCSPGSAAAVSIRRSQPRVASHRPCMVNRNHFVLLSDLILRGARGNILRLLWPPLDHYRAEELDGRTQKSRRLCSCQSYICLGQV